MASILNVLMWYWGRRGAGPRYGLEVARSLVTEPSLRLHLSLSRQCEAFNDFGQLSLPGIHVDTYTDHRSFLKGALRIPSLRRQFVDYVTAHQIDIVYSPMSHLWNAAFLSLPMRGGARYILTLHDMTAHPGDDIWFRNWMLEREIRASDGLITLSNYVRESVVSTHNYPPSRIHVIPLGQFPYGEVAAAPRQLHGNEARLLFFGRIMPYKGLSLMLAAYGELKRAYPRIRLTVVGDGSLGRCADAVEALADVSVVNRWIAEDEIGGFFDQADIVVLPYTEASQSGVVPVAFCKGIPVVCTPVGGLREQVRDGETGILAGAVSADAVARAIRRLIDEPGLYRRCSIGSLEEARTSLSWSKIGSRVVEVMQDIAGRSPRTFRRRWSKCLTGGQCLREPGLGLTSTDEGS